MTRRHVFISGNVQGVYFRDSAREKADELGIAGWIRNLPDGRVEAVFDGDPESVQEILQWCNEGPEAADVKDVQSRPADPTAEPLHGFEVKPTPPR